MLEMGTSGLMSGEGKRVGYLSVPITRPSSTLPDRKFLHQRVGTVLGHQFRDLLQFLLR
jgi:hypothetical protein